MKERDVVMFSNASGWWFLAGVILVGGGYLALYLVTLEWQPDAKWPARVCYAAITLSVLAWFIAVLTNEA